MSAGCCTSLVENRCSSKPSSARAPCFNARSSYAQLFCLLEFRLTVSADYGTFIHGLPGNFQTSLRLALACDPDQPFIRPRLLATFTRSAPRLSSMLKFVIDFRKVVLDRPKLNLVLWKVSRFLPLLSPQIPFAIAPEVEQFPLGEISESPFWCIHSDILSALRKLPLARLAGLPGWRGSYRPR